jgi:hypothetical protein
MRGITLPRLAAVMAVGLLAASACSSDDLRDQNYGTDLAQGYRYPDGGYSYDTATRRDAGSDGDGGGDDGDDGGTTADADAGAAADVDVGAGG